MQRSQLLIFIGIGAAVLIVVLVVGGLLFGRKTPAPQPATLEFWGFEDEAAWHDAVAKFQTDNKHISINYTQLDEKTYEETLLNRLAGGRGPDIFLIKNSWVAKHRDKLRPLPQDTFAVAPSDVRSAFVDVAADDLVLEGTDIIGLPIFVDTPALFYNKDIFNAAGIASAPQTWEEVTKVASTLTALSAAGDITRSGIALGDARNVEHAFEIINTLIFENGERIIERATKTVELSQGASKSLDFYTSFSDKRSGNFSWSGRMKSSLDAFAEGDVAMAIGLPEDVQRIRAKNPHLNFGVRSFPQPKDARRHAVYASYSFPAVSMRSQNPVQAWQFIIFLSSPEGAKSYLEKTAKAPARRDLVAAGVKNEELDAFYKQALIAQSWPVPDEQRTRRIFEEAIASVASKEIRSDEAVSRLREQLQLLLP